MNQQVEGGRVRGGRSPDSSRPAESPEPGLCGGVAVVPGATGCVDGLCVRPQAAGL